jgi:potassium channel subfamily K
MSAKYGADDVRPVGDDTPPKKSGLTGQQKQNIFLGLLVVVYILLAHVLGGMEDHQQWTWAESMYFAVQTFTTVGYGDYTPTTDAGKLFVCAYIHLALVCIAVFLSNIIDSATAMAAEARKKAKKDAMKKGVQKKSTPKATEDSLFHEPNKAEKRWARKKRFVMLLCLHLGTLLGGGLIFTYVEDWDKHYEESGITGTPFVNGLYFSVVTMTTVGYGDITAQDGISMIATVLIMLVGVPIIGVTLQELTGMIFAEQKEELELQLVGAMDGDNLESMMDFTKELAAKCEMPASGHDGKIDRFEFLCFTLVKNNVVEMENIEIAMKNFNELDTDKSGELEVEDLL